MLRTSLLGRFLGVLAAVLFVSEVKAQPVWATFENTVVVDPRLDAGDFQTIQDAIDSVLQPQLRTTILIYAGEYEEEIVFSTDDDNINLVGVDPSAVIIKAPAGTDAITIIGDGPRNHLIANLTIITNDATAGEGRGIVIREGAGTTPPSNVTVRNVTITTQADNSIGIVAEDAVEDVRFEGVTIRCEGDDSKGFEFAALSSDVTITNADVQCDGLRNVGIDFPEQNQRIRITDSTLTISGVHSDAIRITNTSTSVPSEDVKIINVIFNLRNDNVDGIVLGNPAGAIPETAKVLKSLIRGCTFLHEYPVNDAGSNISILCLGRVEDVTIDGMTMYSRVHSGCGIQALDSIRLNVTNTTIIAQDSTMIQVGDDAVVSNCTLICRNVFGDHAGTFDDTTPIWADGTTGLTISNCILEARGEGLRLTKAVSDVVVTNCDIRGSYAGVLIEGGSDIEITNCTIDASSNRGAAVSFDPPQYAGVYVRNHETIDPENIQILNCDLNVFSNRANTDAIGVRVAHASPEDAQAVLVSNCNIKVRAGTAADRAIGATSEEADALYIVGGSIQTFDENEREVDQYDVRNGMQQGVASFAGIRTSGVGYSKWLGPIEAAATPASSIQRSLSVAAQDDDGVLAATNLQATENTVTTGITDPDVPRVLSVTANEAGMDDDVIIIGTNFAGERITDIITLNGTATVVGKKPFAAIDKIILPAGQAQQTVIVGTTNMIGLRFPIAGASSVQQQSKLATISGVQVYRIVTTDSIEAAYSTVDLAATSDDSWEWVVLGSN